MPHRTFLYGLEDRPPLPAMLALGMQHALLAMVFLVYPLAVAQQLGLSAAVTLAFLSSCVFGMAASTALHVLRPPLGSGSLAVEIPTPLFIPTAVLAGTAGGIGAVSVISILSGVTGLVFARLLRRLRALFPAEICGIAVLMLGISIIQPGMRNAFGISGTAMAVQLPALVVSTATLTTMVVLSIFGSQRIKLLALAGGLVVGVALSVNFGLVGAAEWARVQQAPLVAWPSVTTAVPSIDWALVPLALMMGLVQSVDNLGMLVGIQRQVDPVWHKLDLRQASGGIQVSGLGDLVAGMFGGMPTGISSANVGLAHATGAVCRVVSLAAGIMLFAVPFVPKIIIALSLVPQPVVGAIVVYAAVYMVVSGMSLILNRVLNDRRIFIIGFSVVLGLTSALLPGVYADAPPLLRPILESPLTVSTVVAIVLTQVLRFGAALRTSFELELGDTRNESVQEVEVNRTLRKALEDIAAEVGAARPFVDRAIDVTAELVAAMRIAGRVEGAIRLAARIEDARLEITLRYDGLPLPQQTGDGSSHFARLVRHVDRVTATHRENQQTLLLVYQP
jgi:xanthine/uracil permease